MLRFVLVAIGLVLFALLSIRLVREVRSAGLDWRGIGIAIGFVALAFYLRHATGLG